MSDLLKQGLEALRAGDAPAAVAALEQLTAGGEADSSAWLALAFARVNSGDSDGALAAVDRALEKDPRNLRALLFKGDHLDRLGRSRSAMGFYQAALGIAAQLTEAPPRDVQEGLKRAAASSDRLADAYEAHLRGALEAAGFRDDVAPRFAESFDILCGRKPVQYQQPTRYLFPGLPQIAFYPRETFPWLEELESHTAAIRAELEALLAGEERFRPYLEQDPHSPQLNDSSNVGSMDWSAFYLWRDGALVEENAARCPATVAALEGVPGPDVPGQTPTALFSRLKAGTHIPPHNGMVNTRLICHLPIIVPPDCGELRVGNYTRPWVEGEAFVFDDSVEHEAINRSEHERVVLLFDIWRPELTEDERHWVRTLLQAVDTFSD
ncbi:MAG: aspartyl/asparaginyl beta-hydroxylase domain-containing protein [Pseudohaliea sp.]